MVENTSKPETQLKNQMVDNNGDFITIRNGETEDFHTVSPETDSEGMRIVGALGEMLSEQTKKTFGTQSMFVVAQNEDFRLIMFPNKKGFVVWKTDLTLEEALQAIGALNSPKGR
jgi:hypothetical protein